MSQLRGEASQRFLLVEPACTQPPLTSTPHPPSLPGPGAPYIAGLCCWLGKAFVSAHTCARPIGCSTT